MVGVRLAEMAAVVPRDVPVGGQLGWPRMYSIKSVWVK